MIPFDLRALPGDYLFNLVESCKIYWGRITLSRIREVNVAKDCELLLHRIGSLSKVTLTLEQTTLSPSIVGCVWGGFHFSKYLEEPRVSQRENKKKTCFS